MRQSQAHALRRCSTFCVPAASSIVIVGAAILGALNAQQARAQSAEPDALAFELASVKRSGPNDGTLIMVQLPRLLPSGQFTAQNVTLRDLIQTAYTIERMQLFGGPDWITTDRFVIEAKAESGTTTTTSEARSMLRTLLADRFKLTVHSETRDPPLYDLVLARPDGRTGDGLRRSGPECAPVRPHGGGPDGAPAPPPPPPPAAGASTPVGASRFGILRCPSVFFPGQISARAITTGQFAFRLHLDVRRPVVDRTGLTGEFDVDLNYVPEAQGPAIAPTDGGPSIFTALREQLGLKLESQRGPVDVLVVDRAERPEEQ